MKKPSLAALWALALATACGFSASASAAPATMKDGILVDAKGMTVYTFDRDKAYSGKSACLGQCEIDWPPVLATANDEPERPFAIIKRKDGKRQWAYRGKPLYTWPEDQEPGDKYGDNKVKLWHVVKDRKAR
ncbi:MAG: COG4315 family predicted lipoprotein [Ramlibacter sp.]